MGPFYERREDIAIRAPSDIVGEPMTRYVLECPKCLTRFELLKYEPEERTRCRKCRAVMIVPAAPGAEAPPEAKAARPLDPEIRRKLVGILSIRKLALVSCLLAMALAGGFYVLIRKSEARAAEPKPVEEKITLQSLPRKNPQLAMPLGPGFSWEYAGPGGAVEKREVVQGAVGPGGEPEFDVQVRGPAGSVRQTLRVSGGNRDVAGVYLISELRSDGRYVFTPPLKLIPIPMHLDDTWTYEGTCAKEGGGAETWKLEFSGQRRAEAIEGIAGKAHCVPFFIEGVCGGRKVEEVHWFANGVGLVKRVAKVDGKPVEYLLKKYTQRAQ
jgi:hypothetical protein